MTALAADFVRKHKGPAPLRRQSYLMKASTTIYKGSLVCLDANGLAIPAADATGNTDCVGVATAKQVSASSGNYFVVVERGIFLIDCGASITQKDVGDNAYVSTDNDVVDAATASTATVGVGQIMEYLDETQDKVWVDVGRMRPLRFWQSAEITGNGSEQTNAHTLGKVPQGVSITITELPDAAAETGFDIAQGTHTTAAVLATVTNTVKYRIVAWV